MVGAGNGGFSFVEMMGSITVLSVALLGVIATIVTVMRLNEDTRSRTLALTSATRMMEEVQSGAHADIPTSWGAPDNTFDVPGLAAQDGSNQVGQVSVVVDPANSDFLDVSISITWQARSGSRSFEVRRKLADERGGLAWGESGVKNDGADDPGEEADSSSAAGSGGGSATDYTSPPTGSSTPPTPPPSNGDGGDPDNAGNDDDLDGDGDCDECGKSIGAKHKGNCSRKGVNS